MTGILRAHASRLPLRDESVDLIVTSPPYFALRSYRDGGDHYDGQIGSEATPQTWLEALWAVTAECWRVLKPAGSCFINLGDKRSGSGGNNQSGLRDPRLTAATIAATGFRGGPRRYNQAAFGRPKSKMLLPHRYAIGCEDGLADPGGVGWVVRQDIVWQKLNGLPESVTDRTRDSHEYIFHLTKSERYFSAVDEVREPNNPANNAQSSPDYATRDSNGGTNHRDLRRDPELFNPLGKLPGSVWPIASEPLTVPDWLGVDHFAAFPQEIPRRLILGWSPSGICTACGEGRRPVVAKEYHELHSQQNNRKKIDGTEPDGNLRGINAPIRSVGEHHVSIGGYACACPDPDAPTRPSVVLDPFGGTGTTAMVARALGRVGVNVDLSADYCRLARWRVFSSGHASKTRERTNREAQGILL